MRPAPAQPARPDPAARAGGGPTWRPERVARRVVDALATGRRPEPVGPEPGGAAATAGSAPAQAHDAPGSGRPLPPAERGWFERALQADLTTVRVHDDAAAAGEAARRHAAAFTAGERVVLGAAATADAAARRDALAHELVHVLQQRHAPAVPVRHQEEERPRGLGAAPPPEAFDVVEGRAAEASHLLFERDRADLPAGAAATLTAALAGRAGPVTVDVDGYASGEGPLDYNVNLSAHRAAAVARALQGRLPAGSVVRLHAHGETGAFGPAPRNRRAGLRVTEGVPQAAPAGPAVPPPAGAVQAPPTGAPGAVPSPLRLRLDPLRPPGQAAPWLTPPPPRPGVIDWGSMVQTYGEHGARLTLRDADFLEGFGQRQLDLYRGLGFSEPQARWIADTITRRSASVQLGLEGNTAYDRFQLESDRLGWPTTYSTPMIDVLDVLRRIRGTSRGTR